MSNSGESLRGKLYILGMSHDLQCGSSNCSSDEVAAYRAKLRSICELYSIKCIAEEMDVEGLSHYGVTKTIAQQVAADISIRQCHVDLSSVERGALSLDESAIFDAVLNFPSEDGGASRGKAFDEVLNEVRERCWSARIIARQQWPTLFVCGAEHALSMQRLWCRYGLSSVVLHEDYAP